MTIASLDQLQQLSSWVTKKTPVRCINIIQETPDVKTFQFEAIEAQLFHFKPGQFVGMQFEINGEKHNRSYTIASSPSRPHCLELTIKKEVGGIVSPWLHENISIGSSIELRGPAGRFNGLDLESKKVLLISAGSGITPMMSMARFWTDTQPNKDIQFVNWVRAVEDIIFRRELALMDYKYSHFNLEVICTQPGLSSNWLGRRGRINQTVLTDIISDLNERVVFCCGPEGFMTQVKSILMQLDFNMDYYHDESFDPGGKKKTKRRVESNKVEQVQAHQACGPFEIELVKSNRIINIEDNEYLLEKLESESIEIDSGCHAGNCGTCQVKKLSGETVTQNEAGLQDALKNSGYILTCTTQLKSNIKLDL